MRAQVEKEGVPVRLSVSFRVRDGKLWAAFGIAGSDSTPLPVSLDLSDKNNWSVLDGASAEGEFYAHAEGTYQSGDPGYFSPVDGGRPPESPVVDDLAIYLSNWFITDWLSDDETEEVVNALIEEAQKEGAP